MAFPEILILTIEKHFIDYFIVVFRACFLCTRVKKFRECGLIYTPFPGMSAQNLGEKSPWCINLFYPKIRGVSAQQPVEQKQNKWNTYIVDIRKYHIIQEVRSIRVVSSDIPRKVYEGLFHLSSSKYIIEFDLSWLILYFQPTQLPIV